MQFSVIIPIFNVARYFERGLTSLMSQNFTDFEVILVDDGSTDDSGKLCDEAAARYDNVTVIHCKNGGSGPARNIGMAKANGEYIMFFDIDDVIHSDALSIIAKHLSERAVDLLMFSYREIDADNGHATDLKFAPAQLYSNAEVREAYIPEMCGMKFNNGFVWNKAYRRKFLSDNKLTFKPLRIQQDEVFNLELYPKVASAIIIDSVLYDYYVYSNGNTRSRYIPDRLEIYRSIHKHFNTLIDVWGLNDINFQLYVEKRFIISFMEYLRCNILQNPGSHKRRLVSIIKQEMSAPDIRESVGFVLANERTNGINKLLFKAIYGCSVRDYLWLYHWLKSYRSIKKYMKKLV